MPEVNPGLPPAHMAGGSSSFAQFLADYDPGSLPSGLVRPGSVAGSIDGAAPHGTTIVASTFGDGVVMAGDRRATVGNIIAQRDIEKVYPTDDFSMVGIAGTAGLAMEVVRLFQLELEHYEKIEGVPLSMVGKANRLGALIRSNLSMAMQGLAVVPLFAGFDLGRGSGRIFSYDVTGGRYEEHDFYAVGSGAHFARGSLKKLFRRDADEIGAAQVCVEALYDAADDDSATGGPDIQRGIYPLVAVADANGVRMLDESAIADVVATLLAVRQDNPDGPKATLNAPGGEIR